MLCSIFQRYKSRAIHNDPELEIKINGAVFNISKIQIESNSQQYVNELKSGQSCVQYFKDTNREQFTTFGIMSWYNVGCVQYFKDTNREQFTTGWFKYANT